MHVTTLQSTQPGGVLQTRISSAATVYQPRPRGVGTASTLNTIILVLLSIGMGVGLLAMLTGNAEAMNGCLPFAILFAGFLWHGRNLKNRTHCGWITQAALSILGLWWFPLGTVLNGMILYSWFNPETRAWFHDK